MSRKYSSAPVHNFMVMIMGLGMPDNVSSAFSIKFQVKTNTQSPPLSLCFLTSDLFS